jgi:arylamine N-acetyltransferase
VFAVLGEVMERRAELNDHEVEAVLELIEVGRDVPSRLYLGRLQQGYKRHVPWETASRVVRASEVGELAERPRRPPEFWALAMEQGSGGTCFESNYAFWSLLRGLGFEAALHVNDMPQSGSIACHSSVVVRVEGERYLVDVGMGMELVAPVPLRASGTGSVGGPEFRNDVRRVASNRWRVEVDGTPERLRLESGLVYEFVDREWSVDAYDAHVVRDYGDDGIFLDAVRVTRTFGDGSVVRFSPPDTIVRFDGERWSEEKLGVSEDLAGRVADAAGLPTELIERAFAVLGGPERVTRKE